MFGINTANEIHPGMRTAVTAKVRPEITDCNRHVGGSCHGSQQDGALPAPLCCGPWRWLAGSCKHAGGTPQACRSGGPAEAFCCWAGNPQLAGGGQHVTVSPSARASKRTFHCCLTNTGVPGVIPWPIAGKLIIS